MSVTPELLASYQKADYVVFGHQRGAPELVIRIGRPNPGLDQLLERNEAAGAAFVTAANPRGARKSYEENQALSDAMYHAPQLVGYPWFRGEGRDPGGLWVPEPSLLVIGIPRKKAEALGMALHQNAIVFIEKGGKPELVVLV